MIASNQLLCHALADIGSGRYTLRASGRVLKRPGFLAVYRETPDEEADTAAWRKKMSAHGIAKLDKGVEELFR